MLLCILTALCVASLSVGSTVYGQPSGCIWKDQLFVAINSRDAPEPSALYRGTFTPRPNQGSVRYWNPILWKGNSSQALIDIRHDRVLLLQGGGMHYIFPLEKVPLLEETDFGTGLVKKSGYRDIMHFIDAFSGEDTDLFFPSHREHDVTIKQAFPDRELAPGADYLNIARYSMRIADEKAVRLFHAYKSKLFVSIEPDYLTNWYRDNDGNPINSMPKLPGRELKTCSLPVDFVENFAAYATKGRDYLVTSNGKLYSLVSKSRTELELKAIWVDPKQRLVGVIRDLENDKVYGWGFEKNIFAPGRFYIEFNDKPLPGRYKQNERLRGDCYDSYIESYECSRAFRQANQK